MMKRWNVSAKHADGTPLTFETTGDLPDEAAVKAHYAKHLPNLSDVSAEEADKPAEPRKVE